VRQARVGSRKEQYLEESQYVVRGLPSRFEVGDHCKGWKMTGLGEKPADPNLAG